MPKTTTFTVLGKDLNMRYDWRVPRTLVPSLPFRVLVVHFPQNVFLLDRVLSFMFLFVIVVPIIYLPLISFDSHWDGCWKKYFHKRYIDPSTVIGGRHRIAFPPTESTRPPYSVGWSAEVKVTCENTISNWILVFHLLAVSISLQRQPVTSCYNAYQIPEAIVELICGKHHIMIAIYMTAICHHVEQAVSSVP